MGTPGHGKQGNSGQFSTQDNKRKLGQALGKHLLENTSDYKLLKNCWEKTRIQREISPAHKAAFVQKTFVYTGETGTGAGAVLCIASELQGKK